MFKTKAAIKLEFIDSPTEVHVGLAKASIAEAVKDVTQKELIQFSGENKQPDLMYFKAVYATCGFNLNDDVFMPEEFWPARLTPILKPVNLEHDSETMVGVIYAVQAQALNGQPYDIESAQVPSDPFETIIYGVIYKYHFPQLASVLASNESFSVSMESWFRDFSYAVLLDDKGTIQVIDRTDSTIALDRNLRCFGGGGQYNGHRIGRVLKDITFGGVGIVQDPANPRSEGEVIASIQNLEKTMSEPIKEVVTVEKTVTADEQKLADANKILELAEAGLTTDTPPEIAKIDNATDKFAAKLAFLSQTGKAIAEKNATLVAENTALASKLASVTTELTDLTSKVTDLTKIVSNKDSEIAALKITLADLQKYKDDAEAAKKVKEDEMKMEEMKKKKMARCSEVEGLFGPQVMAALQPSFEDLDEVAYNKWIEEKKIIAASITLKKDGGQGSPEEEGRSGESKVQQEPRHKVSIASVLETAKVEPALGLTETEPNVDKSFGFAALLSRKMSKGQK